jgi:uncharacterized metal-binding protein
MLMNIENNVPCQVSRKKVIGLLPCSGACNVGMLTTKCVTQMAQKYGNINFVCSLGIPLGIEGIVNNAKKSEYYIAINGCKVGCASKALKSIDLLPDNEIIVTEDLGIQKNKNYSDENGLDSLVSSVETLISNI